MPATEPTSASAGPSIVPSSRQRTPSSATATSRRRAICSMPGWRVCASTAAIDRGDGIAAQSTLRAASSTCSAETPSPSNIAHFALAGTAQALHVGIGSIGEAARKVAVDEAGAHEVPRHGAGQKRRGMPRLDAKALVDRQRDTFAHRVETGERCRITAVRVRDELVTRSRPVEALGSLRAKAWSIPRLHRTWMREHPGTRGAQQFFARHDLVDRAAGQCLGRRQPPRLEHERQRRCDADQARQSLRAASRRQQADAHFDQADPYLVVVDHDTVVAAQRQLVATAQGRAVDRHGDRLAANVRCGAARRSTGR